MKFFSKSFNMKYTEKHVKGMRPKSFFDFSGEKDKERKFGEHKGRKISTSEIMEIASRHFLMAKKSRSQSSTSKVDL